MISRKFILVIFSLLFLCFFYWYVCLKYSPNELDLFWSYSWAVGLSEYNNRSDLYFRPFDRVGGSQIFHLVPTYLLSIIYKLFGHQILTLQLSIYFYFFIFYSTTIFFIRSYLKLNIVRSIIFSSMIALLEPFFRSIISLRPEIISLSISLFLITIASLSKKNYIFIIIGFLSLFIVESHITGIIGFAFLLIYIFFNKEKKLYKYFFIGFILSIFFYLFSHQNFLFFDWLDDLFARRTMDGYSSSIYVYFFMSKFGRHFPEFILSIITFYYIFKNLNFKNSFDRDLLFFLISSIFLLEILGRGNPLYLIWFYLPLFLLLLLKKRSIFNIFFVFYFIQYFAIFLYNDGYSHKHVYEMIRKNTNNQSIIHGPHIAFLGSHKPHNFRYNITIDNNIINQTKDIKELDNLYFLCKQEYCNDNFFVIDTYKFWSLGKYKNE